MTPFCKVVFVFFDFKPSKLVFLLVEFGASNTRRLLSNALSFEEVRSIVLFVQSYADIHAILLPGRIPGYKRDDLQFTSVEYD